MAAKKNWYLNFGPYVGFLLSAKATTNNLDVKSFFNSTDAGIDIGVGVKFPVGENTKFFVEFNAEGGIANINTGTTTFRNAVSALNIGLNFR